MDNSTHDSSELLIRFLDGELTANEKADVERRLEKDLLLQEELENLRLARKAVKFYGLNQKVAGIHRQMMKEIKPVVPVKQINSTRRIIRYSIAITASLLIIFLGIEAYNFFTLSPDKVFAANYQSYELRAFRNNGTEPSAIENAYREKKYKKVIALQEQYNSIPIRETFLAAMSNVELGDNDMAIVLFRKVIAEMSNTTTNLLKDDAEYYLALTYLRNKEYNSSLELFQKINADPNHLYYEKVTRKLLRQVKRLR